MRSFVMLVVGTFGLSGVAYAQSPGPTSGRGYVEAVAQSALSNVTSQSFGGELGVTVVPNVQVFVEGGLVHDVATADISASAQAVAGYLSQTQANVLYKVKQPVTFGVAGVSMGCGVSGMGSFSMIARCWRASSAPTPLGRSFRYCR